MSERPAGLAELRQRRQERGLSLDDLAVSLRIPVAQLEAIEAGRFDELPEGPYRVGHVRAVFAHLDLDPSEALLARAGRRDDGPPPPPPVPLWTIRVGALGVAVALLGVLAWQLSQLPAEPEPREAAPVDVADQHVRLEALRTAPFTVWVDGELVMDRVLPGGEVVELSGRRRVEIALDGVETARVDYNGRRVSPQGRQDVPRKLVFIDDLDAGG